MFLAGLKFGMLLQIAIGPVCMYIFSLGTNSGFTTSFTGVLGVVLADGLYILLALLGISAFIKDKKRQLIFKYLGSIIIIVFGLELFLSYFGISLLPSINIFKGSSSSMPFLKAFILTAANPMTILFWIGVFSTKVSDSDMSGKDNITFALGAVFATLFFLTLIGYLGSILSGFLPKEFLRILNSVVGVVLIYFGLKKFPWKKEA